MGTLDTIIVCVIVVFGLFIMYRALKEPLDLLFGAIGKGLVALKEMIGGETGERVEEIRYG